MRHKVDEQIITFINEDETLKQKYDLMLSVKGVGKLLATMPLVYTHGFERLADSRKLACYSGVTPFVYESGTSVRGKMGVSQFANVWLFAVAGIGGFKNGAQRNVKADLL